jgi:hypothetical protein
MEDTNYERMLALDLHPRSFGFVVFEGQDTILDWGVKSFRRGANAVKVPMHQKLATLLGEFSPHIVILKESKGQPERSSKTVLRLVESRGMPVRLVSGDAVRRVFASHSHNKHEIATAVAQRFPELQGRLPPKRRPWESEDYRMSIFDAAALGITHFRDPA